MSKRQTVLASDYQAWSGLYVVLPVVDAAEDELSQRFHHPDAGGDGLALLRFWDSLTYEEKRAVATALRIEGLRAAGE